MTTAATCDVARAGGAAVASQSHAVTTTTPSDVVTLVVYDSYPDDDRPTQPNPLQVALDEFTADTGIEVELLKSQDAGHDAVEGDAHRRQPRRRRDVGRRQHAAVARDRGSACSSRTSRRPWPISTREFTALVPERRGDAGRLRRRVRQLRHRRARRQRASSRRRRSTDLAQPEYAGKLVVENAGTSSPGLAFLLATIAKFGEDGWEEYWTELHANGVLVVDGWNEAYYDVVHVGPAATGRWS